MKQPTHKVVLSLLLLSNASGVLADAAKTATPYIASIRSQSANLALEMVGQEKYYVNRNGATENFTVFSLTPGYQQTFRGYKLACCMFGPDIAAKSDCAQLNISGSGVTGRGSCDWLADYFGLPTDFKSSITFSPRISSIMVDANFYMGLDGWKEGMYFRMHAPYVNTRWRLNPSEGSVTAGTNGYDFGYFSGDNATVSGGGNPNSQLLTRALQFFSQGQVPSLTNNLTYVNAQGSSVSSVANPASSYCGIAGTDLTSITYSDGIVFEPLEYAQWACGTLVKNGVADLRFTLGYNAHSSDRHHIGLGLTGAAPTGNRPHGVYALEPIVGNGKHWELGAQVTSHFRFWQSEDEECCFTGYLDANITHLFKARQRRTFDLVGKPNSRYMLAMELGQSNYLYNAIMQKCITANYGPASANSASAGAISGIGGFDAVLTVGLTPAAAQFQNHYAPVANLTTVDVNVTVGAQIDLDLMFSYCHRNWSIDLGYNFWALTCERINLDCKDCPSRLADGKTWVLKGDAYVYGVNYGTSNIVLDTENFADAVLAGYNVGAGDGNPYALGVSESKATIHGGSTAINVSTVPTAAPVYENYNVDSPRFAVAGIPVELAAINTTDSVTVAQERSGVHTVYTPLYGNFTGATTYGNPRVMNSLDPIYLTENDLDLDGARTKGLSNKVFAHFSYQWKKDEYTPFLGFGASGEFLGSSSCCAASCTTASTSSASVTTTNTCGNSCKSSCSSSCKSSCSSSCSEGGCKRCGLSQWSVWIKGGVSFN